VTAELELDGGTWKLALHVTSRRASGERALVVFHQAKVIVGRDKQFADLVLPDSNVSRRHCTFTVDETGTVWIQDLGSTNGMWVNGRQARHQIFGPTDVLMAGDHSIRLAEPPSRVPA